MLSDVVHPQKLDRDQCTLIFFTSLNDPLSSWVGKVVRFFSSLPSFAFFTFLPFPFVSSLAMFGKIFTVLFFLTHCRAFRFLLSKMPQVTQWNRSHTKHCSLWRQSTRSAFKSKKEEESRIVCWLKRKTTTKRGHLPWRRGKIFTTS